METVSFLNNIHVVYSTFTTALYLGEFSSGNCTECGFIRGLLRQRLLYRLSILRKRKFLLFGVARTASMCSSAASWNPHRILSTCMHL